MIFTYQLDGVEVLVTEAGANGKPMTEAYYYVDGELGYDLQDNSFDYAGTHCTHGQSGTHDPGDSVSDDWEMRIDGVTDEDNVLIPLKDIVLDSAFKQSVFDSLDEDDLVSAAHDSSEDAKVEQQIASFEAREADR